MLTKSYAMNCLRKNQSHEKLSTICAKSIEVLTRNKKSLTTCMNISFIHKATVIHSKLDSSIGVEFVPYST